MLFLLCKLSSFWIVSDCNGPKRIFMCRLFIAGTSIVTHLQWTFEFHSLYMIRYQLCIILVSSIVLYNISPIKLILRVKVIVTRWIRNSETCHNDHLFWLICTQRCSKALYHWRCYIEPHLEGQKRLTCHVCVIGIWYHSANFYVIAVWFLLPVEMHIYIYIYIY